MHTYLTALLPLQKWRWVEGGEHVAKDEDKYGKAPIALSLKIPTKLSLSSEPFLLSPKTSSFIQSTSSPKVHYQGNQNNNNYLTLNAIHFQFKFTF